MTPQLTTSTVMPARIGRSWAQRVWQSNAFAWIVSGVLHGLLFLGLYMVALREEPALRRIIIPEARLAAAPGDPATGKPLDQKPLQLSPRSENTVAMQPTRSDEQVVSMMADG